MGRKRINKQAAAKGACGDGAGGDLGGRCALMEKEINLCPDFSAR